MTSRIRTFDQLSLNELYQLLELRAMVFVVEQECPYQDPDGKDAQAIHVLGYEGSDLAAYTRMFLPGDYFNEAAIGRVVTSPDYRGKGLGKSIMETSIAWIRNELGPGVPIRLSAQTYLTRFYESLGFEIEGEPYLEDDIPHIGMVKKK